MDICCLSSINEMLLIPRDVSANGIYVYHSQYLYCVAHTKRPVSTPSRHNVLDCSLPCNKLLVGEERSQI